MGQQLRPVLLEAEPPAPCSPALGLQRDVGTLSPEALCHPPEKSGQGTGIQDMGLPALWVGLPEYLSTTLTLAKGGVAASKRMEGGEGFAALAH